MKIPGYSKYDITENGDITLIATGEPVARHVSTANSYRYTWVYIIPDGDIKPHQTNLHVLVALAFHGPRPDGHVVKFLDGDTRNVCASNLAWVRRGSLMNKVTTGRVPKQNKSCNPESVKLVYETLEALDKPISMLELASLLQVPYTTIRYSMYGLMALGKVQVVQGGYTIV